ncbi:MAG: peptide chain release factor 1 [Clostridia bacterium]|nr:peptide chain release factor 1 [Clostridia bacterium]
MLTRLKQMKERFARLAEEIADPDIIADQARWRELVREHSRLGPIVEAYDKYAGTEASIAECKAIIGDKTSEKELRELAEEELSELEAKAENELAELRVLLLPKDKNDERNVIVEIRAGTGGDEAALFGAVLMRMYERYAERHNFRCELIDINETEMGGVKEAVFSVSGRGVYSRLKFESGVHRVQRVPETETQGRIHTSAATVAVLPEAEDIEVEIDPGDLRIDTYRSSGAGGQHVNKTESAIRITHIPTGLVVQSQDERSQGRNKEQAMKVLKSRLYELYSREQAEKEASARRSQVGSGDRSERIRTYNFPQGRVTDHRINMTLYKLPQFIDGDMDEIIEALILAERTRLLSGEDQ